MTSSILVGLVVSIGISLLALSVGVLRASGAMAAVVVGTISVAAGWDWVSGLLAFFVATSALSAIGASEKRGRTESIVEKLAGRDAWQVLANGGVFTGAAVAFIRTRDPSWMIAGFGALAAATSDSWSTEIGTLTRAVPRSITTGRSIPAGTSGGITIVGTLAGVGGAAFISLVSLMADWGPWVAACVFIGGIIGSTVDSILGATVQMRRRCIACGAFTERRVHNCGGSTRLVRGIRGFDNDGVNVAATLVGALIAYLFSLVVLR